MPAKSLLFDGAAREALLRGAAKLSKAVASTLGPKGHTVVIEKPLGLPLVTKDGVSVAEAIELTDANENIGAQMVREVARTTANTA